MSSVRESSRSPRGTRPPRAGDSRPCVEAAKIEAVREFLKDSRYTADLAAKLAPEANKDARQRAEKRVALCEQRLALHDQRVQVERDIAALGEKP